MRDERTLYEYNSEYGGTYRLAPSIGMYANTGNLSLRFHHYGEKEAFAFCSATINIIPLAYLESAIDVNDNGMKMLEFLEENGFGERTPFVVESGYCVYPIFKFNADKLQKIDPKVFAEYQKSFGLEAHSTLAEKISSAAGRASDSSQKAVEACHKSAFPAKTER